MGDRSLPARCGVRNIRIGHQKLFYRDLIAGIPLGTAHTVGPDFPRQLFALCYAKSPGLEDTNLFGQRDDARKRESACFIKEPLNEFCPHALTLKVW